jgi:hypothetical protein
MGLRARNSVQPCEGAGDREAPTRGGQSLRQNHRYLPQEDDSEARVALAQFQDLSRLDDC